MNSKSQPQQSVYGYSHNQHPQAPSMQNQNPYQPTSSHNGYTAIRSSRRQLYDVQPTQYTPVQQMHPHQIHTPVQQSQSPIQRTRKRKLVRAVKTDPSYPQSTEAVSANKHYCEMIAKHIKRCKQCRALYKRNNSLMGVIIILLVIIMYLLTKLIQ